MKNGRYQIVTTTWHVMHFWDLFNALADDADFFLLHNNHRSWMDERFLAVRPIPENASFVPYYEPGKYDMAILDVDQQCANLNLGKAKLPLELNALITDIPKVFINHGSPVYPELLCKMGATFAEAEDECRQLIKHIVGDTPMVVNSYRAASPAEWGWGIPIWHGMDPTEWYDFPKEPRAFTALSPAGLDAYYNRECMSQVLQQMRERSGHTLWWAKENVHTENNLELYKDFLGRSLIYVDTSIRTPMNRARTEAMLSGCCIVQVEGAHDLERLVGVDGKSLGDYMLTVPNDPIAIADTIADLLEHRYQECVDRGQAAKQMAMETFNRGRYRMDWLKLIRTVTKT